MAAPLRTPRHTAGSSLTRASTTPFGFSGTAAKAAEGVDLTGSRTDTRHGVARYAVDPDHARRLCALSEELSARTA
ncbi:short-chain dehydrogenase [Streptomyces sp. NPDC048710]|uniref:short-chain dehydrogenase n=1 Tax=unclassified Streptomyces TaxID=2593676 RepID=UPI0037121292